MSSETKNQFTAPITLLPKFTESLKMKNPLSEKQGVSQQSEVASF